jgi:hypothetical protein
MNDFFIVLGVTALFILGLYVGFILKHEKERKKEIRKANGDKSGIGQPNKFVHDVASRTSTTPATSPASTKA